MKIVKLEPSQHKTGRWLVWFEDGSLLRVGEGDVIALSLYEGEPLDGQEAAALTAAAEHSKLNERAVELLSARAMSRKELVDKLSAPRSGRRKPGEERHDPDPEEAERCREERRIAANRVADHMEQIGLLNDEEYSRTIVRHYCAKGFGVRRIRDELYRRGVPREFWDGALSELSEQQEGGESRLDELVRKKLRGTKPAREELNRVSAYLARRGFGWDEISAALERYALESRDDEF